MYSIVEQTIKQSTHFIVGAYFYERKMTMKNSYTTKGLHTVSQYKIMQEINKNFEEESVDIAGMRR